MRAMMMLSFRNIRKNRLRFVLTAFAVLLGVSFVVASFVLSDGLRSTFNTMVDEGYSGIDAEVRARSDFDEVLFTYRYIDESLLDVVESAHLLLDGEDDALLHLLGAGAGVGDGDVDEVELEIGEDLLLDLGGHDDATDDECDHQQIGGDVV